ncbi:hypothetical protein [Legionella sp. km772]|uniref:hypothetical protein n=1 Tax=Legionella sp. km772 TaxID=2498111 RepID=UPI000F8DC3B3|nr:hypothetical protein [Legionella sp. km772]RUR11645.1 hypothetical protein ELY15_06885 [Legionella sp. km772]
MTKELNVPSTPETAKQADTQAAQATEKKDESKTPSPTVNRYRFLGSCAAEAARWLNRDNDFDRGPGPIC